MNKYHLDMTDEEIEAAVREDFKDLEDGCYHIDNGEWQIWTGKGGYINYRIALEKTLIRELKKHDKEI